MGQALPLPKRIPRPTRQQERALGAMGIQCDMEEKNEDGQHQLYVRYTLPTGWRMVDQSHRSDLPNFVIIDAGDMIRCRVRGSWKGGYDNELYLKVEDGTDKFIPPQEAIEYSEPSQVTVLASLAEAYDPYHAPRDPAPKTCERLPDYTPGKDGK
jgi:hypothetical protein